MPKTSFDHLKTHIRDIPDFPKPGIIFKDITPLLLDADAFRETVDILYERYVDSGVTKIAAIESRGFLWAAPLCYRMGVGFAPLRKPGKLPGDTIQQSYTLEYGEAALEIHKDAVRPGDKVVLLDDLLATGGTASASASLISQLGGEIIESSFIVELGFLKGRAKLNGTPVFSMLQY